MRFFQVMDEIRERINDERVTLGFEITTGKCFVVVLSWYNGEGIEVTHRRRLSKYEQSPKTYEEFISNIVTKAKIVMKSLNY